jgi:hypothetical protein
MMVLPVRAVEFGVRYGTQAVTAQRVIGVGPTTRGQWNHSPEVLISNDDDRVTDLLCGFANVATDSNARVRNEQEIATIAPPFLKAYQAFSRNDVVGDKELAKRVQDLGAIKNRRLSEKAMREIVPLQANQRLSTDARIEMLKIVESSLADALHDSLKELEVSGDWLTSVRDFTVKWGPLICEFVPDEAFDESAMEWCWEQSKFRTMWEDFASGAAPRKFTPKKPIKATKGDTQPLTDRELDEGVKKLLVHPGNEGLGLPGDFCDAPPSEPGFIPTPDWAQRLENHAALAAVNAEIERLRAGWKDFFPKETRTYFPVNSVLFEGFGRTPGPDGTLRFPARNLVTFMSVVLCLIDHRYLRKCNRPDCEHPYFISHDSKERYCSDKCRNWARRYWKTEGTNLRRKEFTAFLEQGHTEWLTKRLPKRTHHQWVSEFANREWLRLDPEREPIDTATRWVRKELDRVGKKERRHD